MFSEQTLDRGAVRRFRVRLGETHRVAFIITLLRATRFRFAEQSILKLATPILLALEITTPVGPML